MYSPATNTPPLPQACSQTTTLQYYPNETHTHAQVHAHTQPQCSVTSTSLHSLSPPLAEFTFSLKFVFRTQLQRIVFV